MRGKRLQLLPTSLVDNSAVTTARTSVDEIERELLTQLRDAIARAKTSEATFMAFEQALVTTVQLLGRLLLMVFLSVREERERAKTPERIMKGGSTYRRRPAQARNLNTVFGVVRYFRTYFRGPHGHGFHPLDIALGLTADRMSRNVLGLAARLATTLSFARVHAVLGWFLGAAPSTEVIENTVLGLGRRTNEWFERAPAPDDDGEVLILQFDSKGAPTATQTELERRRLGFQRKRAPLQSVLSQTRHYKGSGYGPIMRRTDDLRGGRRSSPHNDHTVEQRQSKQRRDHLY